MTAANLLRGFESQVAEIEGTRTRYFVGGAGSPVILVHGLGGAATHWAGLAPLLARGRRVLVPDLPGHGRSDPLASVESLTAFADSVAAVARREGMLPAPVVGHSMGGLVGVRLALSRPDAVSALALVATAGIVSGTRKAEVAYALYGLVAELRRLGVLARPLVRSGRVRQAVFGYWGAADPLAMSEAAALGFLQGGIDTTDAVSASRALLRDDPRQELDAIRCPVLLVWGARDRIVPLADGFEFARRLRAPLRAVAAAGHLVIGERPEECAAILEEFLDGVREVEELPVEPELVGEPRGEGLDA